MGEITDIMMDDDAMEKWYELGLALNICEDLLNDIEDGGEDCWEKMLSIWRKLNEPKPSWEGMVNALQKPSVELEDLAKKVAKKYLKGICISMHYMYGVRGPNTWYSTRHTMRWAKPSLT